MAAISASVNAIRSDRKQKDFSDSSLQKSIKFVLILAQCFALMPVHGIISTDISKIKFKWLSLKILYSMANILGSFGLAVMNILRFLYTGMHFGDMVAVIFFMSSILVGILFISIAKNWFNLSKKWLAMELVMKKYEYQPNLNRTFKITAIVLMSLALAEHLLFISKVFLLTLKCPIMKTNPMKGYFGAAFSQIFAETEYAHWKAILLEILNILATFAWNFMDLFIMLMSRGLAERFKQINKRVQMTEVKNEVFWKEIREDYNGLSLLCDDLDHTITHLVTLSFANNLFFICVQLFNTLQPIRGLMDSIYFIGSFGFLLARTVAVSVNASWIHDESRVLLPYLFKISSENYGTEANRLIQQISTSPIAISGSKYFYVTRSLCLTVGGAIITFELILQQIGPLMLNLNGDNSEDTVFCVT